MKPNPLFKIITPALAAIFLAACGKNDKAGSSSGGATDSVGADGIRIIRLTGNDALQYNVKEITVAPGEKLNIELTNVGKMPKQSMAHNFVLLNKPLGDAEVTALAMAASTKVPDYLPDDKSTIMVHTRMLGPDEKDTVQLTAPAEPGSYPYLCTFPGHFTLMKGQLIVKAK